MYKRVQNIFEKYKIKIRKWIIDRETKKLTKFSIHNLMKYLRLMLQRYISYIYF